MRVATRILVAVVAALATHVAAARVASAACTRSCPVDQRDEHGCCPTKPSRPRSPPRPVVPSDDKAFGKLAELCASVEECIYSCVHEQRSAMCVRAAELTESGRGREDVDLQDARKFYGIACDAGLQTGCAGLAGLMDRGAGGPLDDAGAEARYRTACEAGVARACEGLARMQLGGQAVPRKGEPMSLLRRGEALLTRDCQRAVDGACLRLVTFHDPVEGLRPDPVAMRAAFARALAYAHARCAKGYLDGCVVEAELQLDTVRNPAPKPAEGAARLGILCNDRVPAACGALAAHLRLSRRADDVELVEVATSGCTSGKVARACVVLGQLEEAGARWQPAVNAYQIACAGGEAIACVLLAGVYARTGALEASADARERACALSAATCSSPVGAPPRPRVALRNSCDLAFDAVWRVSGNAGTLVVSVPGPGKLQLSVTAPSKGGRWPVMTKDRANPVYLLLSTADNAWGNFAGQANSAQVAGEIEVRRFDPNTGFTELEFHGVRLISSRGDMCELEGTLQTYGRDY